ncbi:hypothetical protein BHMPCIPO_04954 [Ensifer sesbaniae]|nr:hypothetical protein [Ensifer sesbaniae]
MQGHATSGISNFNSVQFLIAGTKGVAEFIRCTRFTERFNHRLRAIVLNIEDTTLHESKSLLDRFSFFCDAGDRFLEIRVGQLNVDEDLDAWRQGIY